MIVVDASATVIAVTDTTDRGAGARAAFRGTTASAPHLFDAEVGQAIRGLVLRNEISSDAAWESVGRARTVVTDRFPHAPLLSRAWELRDTVSFYDGLYVALAEALGETLVTADRRLSKATGPRCDFLLV